MPESRLTVQVVVSGEVAGLRSGDTGTRLVRVGEQVVTFSRQPTYLTHIPPEVANDAQLKAARVSYQDIVKAGGKITLLPGEEAPAPYDGEHADDPTKLTVDKLRDLASELGLDTEGVKKDLLARIAAYYWSFGVVFNMKPERIQ